MDKKLLELINERVYWKSKRYWNILQTRHLTGEATTLKRVMRI